MKTATQLRLFRKELIRYSGDATVPEFPHWMDAFEHLETYLEKLPMEKRKVVFLDEMPWIDAKQSDFVMALDYFWNNWAANRDDIVLIACGSATSWMADKLLENPGGLHNRVTRRIYLRPFTLHECQQYLTSRGFDWDLHLIMECYMVLGGVPFYWSLLEPQLSLPQNIDRLCFRRDGALRMEFDELYSALFSHAGNYISIVQQLAEHPNGMTRDEIAAATNLSGGTLTKLLKNLERCDFIMFHSQFGSRSKNATCRLCDFYTLFYFKFLHEERGGDAQFWSHHFQRPQITAWKGLTFELVCMAHVSQIKKALGISGMATQVSSWRYLPPRRHAAENLPYHGGQIDLLIARADKIIHLCECKFAPEKYTISKDYEQHLRERQEVFRQVTHTRCGIVHTFITPYGIAPNSHRAIVHSEVTAEELFADE